MKRLLLFLFGLTLISSSNPRTSYNIKKNTTIIYLVRHAEKELSDKSNKDPELTAKGLKRANNLALTLSEANIDAVYSTNYIRTIETAKPTAELFNKDINIYDWKSLNVDKIVKDNLGRNVLIVGHSDATPIFANKLLEKEIYKPIDASDYSNLYIVTIIDDHKSSVRLKLK
jgi:2,3-bisphosphoglycerate-dependent phosphoglycerate mutase